MSARAAFALFLATATAALQEEISLMHVAQLASQDVVADKWPAEGPDASSLLCATPSRVGHVTKNPNIRHTPFVTPLAEVVELTKDLRMPLYAGCQVWSVTCTHRARSLLLLSPQRPSLRMHVRPFRVLFLLHSYKRVTERSHTVEEWVSVRPHKPHAASQPSLFSHTHKKK